LSCHATQWRAHTSSLLDRDYIRDQRRNVRISLRQWPTGRCPNPYLSQIERGLRHPAPNPPSIAKGLRIRRTLYVGPVILEERSSSPEVTAAIRRPRPDRRQKRVQIDIDETFRRENAVAAVGTVLRGSLPSTTTATARTPRRAGHPGSSPRVSKRAASARRRTQAAAQ